MSHARGASSGKTWVVIVALSAVSIGVFAEGARGAQPADGTVTQPSLDSSSGGFGIKGAERCMMRKINRRRAGHGLGRLDRDAQLIYVARRHASGMAANQAVYHDANIGQRVTHWNRLGQNTGRGADCGGLFTSFMHSSTHRSNILGTWRHFGVGVDRRDGRIYVQQIFESRLNPGNVYNHP